MAATTQDADAARTSEAARVVTSLRAAWVSGTLGSLASTAALVWCGAHRNGSALAPTNATSHWLWGERAMHKRRFSIAHTVTGYSIHHAASVFWAGVYESCRRSGAAAPGPARAATLALAVSALAYFIDYTLTPRRLTPGFERHLPRRARAIVYLAFAAGLALPALVQGSGAGVRRRSPASGRVNRRLARTSAPAMSRFTDGNTYAKSESCV